MIPSFAVGRTQELIYEFNRFYENNRQYQKDLEELMVYVDSPMATTATEVFKRNAQVFDDEMKEIITNGDNPLDFKNLRFTRSTEDSIALNHNDRPKVIISASGMCEAGRIQKEPKHIFLVHGEPESKEDFARTVEQKLGYHPIVVQGNSEFVLEKDEILNKREAMQEAMDSEALESVKKNIADIHRRLEGILYNTHLAVDSKLSPEKLAKINNIVLELEKDSVNLGAAVTEENR